METNHEQQELMTMVDHDNATSPPHQQETQNGNVPNLAEHCANNKSILHPNEQPQCQQ